MDIFPLAESDARRSLDETEQPNPTAEELYRP
jgi:hypothetical protein